MVENSSARAFQTMDISLGTESRPVMLASSSELSPVSLLISPVEDSPEPFPPSAVSGLLLHSQNITLDLSPLIFLIVVWQLGLTVEGKAQGTICLVDTQAQDLGMPRLTVHTFGHPPNSSQHRLQQRLARAGS